MATISGSSTDNWSSVSFPALDLDGEIATFAGRFSSILNEFIADFQARTLIVLSASSSSLKVLLDEGTLTLSGSKFSTSPVITSIVFDNSFSGELIRLSGKIDGVGNDRITSITYSPPDGSHKTVVKGDVSINAAGDFSGKVSSITIQDDGGSTIVLAGSGTLSGNQFGATILGSITSIKISGPGGSATISGLALPWSAVEGIDSPADLLSRAPLLAGNDKIGFSSTIGIELNGGAGDDTITGGVSADTLLGGNDNDVLDGQGGVDALSGGEGNDIYIVRVADQDTLTESADQGSDTVRLLYNVLVASTVNVATFENIENIEAVGTGVFHLIGDDQDNALTGNASGNELTGGDGDDILDGRGGVDTMAGGGGNDLYVLDRPTDVFTEEAGSDTVRLAYSVSRATAIDIETMYGGNIENVQVTGGGAFNLFGSGMDNALAGNGSANTLDGRAGADTMAGNGGNDTYWVDSEDDVIVEAARGGTDTVRLLDGADSYALSADVENLMVSGTGARSLTGNASHNSITGGEGNDTLVGGGGNDTLRGGGGDDVYEIGEGKDSVVELAGGGHDLVRSSASFSIGALLQVEDLELTGSANLNAIGNSGVNVLTGNAGDNILDGGADAGADTLIGGLGNDTFIVRSLTGDTVIEHATGGDDTVRISFNTKLALTIDLSAAFQNMENGELLGAGAFHLTGTDGDNRLIGNASANTLTGAGGDDLLDGKGGVDTMIGGLGDDTYVIDRASDVITEADGEGSHDSVLVAFKVSSATTVTLAANLEHATVTGTGAFRLVGNAADNVLTGNASANRLDGGAGDDTLDGRGGVDTLVGGAGNDRLLIDSLSDVIDETGGGIDVVRAVITTKPSALTTIDLAARFGGNVEHLEVDGPGRFQLLGNAAANHLIASAKDDTLNGRAGADTMQGGAGNDSYFVDDLDDVITDTEGADTVFADADAIIASRDLDEEVVLDMATAWAGVEHVTVTGLGNVSVVGSAAANRITGNDGDNTLDGGIGADTLAGGWGNDRYVIDVADILVEAEGNGVDTVVSSLFSYTLGENFENLELVTGAIHGVGNAENNLITGGDANNSLSGLGGNDTLVGGSGNDALHAGSGDDALSGGEGNDFLKGDAGNDTLEGNAGEDQFWLDAAGVDTIADFSAEDEIVLNTAVFTAFPFPSILSPEMFLAGDGVTSATDAAQRLIYDTASGALYYDPDGVDGAAALQIATLTGAPTVTATDFVLAVG